MHTDSLQHIVLLFDWLRPLQNINGTWGMKSPFLYLYHKIYQLCLWTLSMRQIMPCAFAERTVPGSPWVHIYHRTPGRPPSLVSHPLWSCWCDRFTAATELLSSTADNRLQTTHTHIHISQSNAAFSLTTLSFRCADTCLLL